MSAPRIIVYSFIATAVMVVMKASWQVELAASFIACLTWVGCHEAVNYFEAKK